MKTLIFLSVFCVNDTLPPDSTLIKSLIQFYQLQIIAESSKHAVVEQKGYLKYLPSLGTGFNQEGKLRPTISFSVNSIYQYFNDKSERKQMIESIKLQNEQLMYLDLLELKEALRKYHYLKSDLEHERRVIQKESELIEIDKKLFEIQEMKFKQNQILPSEFLKSKRTILVSELNFDKRKEKLNVIRRELKELEFMILRIAKVSD